MNLLIDPVFRVRTPEGAGRMNLPQVLEALGKDQIESFTGLQRHQEDAFHIFLCYLAGAVLSRDKVDDAKQDAAFWLDAIRKLTLQQGCDDDDAWTLVVEDPTKPAFMQTAFIDKKTADTLKVKALAPDELDILPTAKNHDVKRRRGLSAEEDDWVYALISLQTMAGFFGQGNYGISRMNGGFGSRPVVSMIYGCRSGERFLRDVRSIVAEEGPLLDGPWEYKRDGISFTWIVPWDLKSSISLKSLSPFFIETSRALRMARDHSRLSCKGSPTKASRVEAKSANGLLGDPWIPVNRGDKKKGESALTLSKTGWSPKLLRDLIFEDGYTAAALQKHDPTRQDSPCSFQASVLVRGQGTTDGFHEASIPIPSKAVLWLSQSGPEREGLATLSKTAINDAGTMDGRVLRPAFFALLESNPDRVGDWWSDTHRSFSAIWSADFFPWLWRASEQEDKDLARREWIRSLRDKAYNALQDAVSRHPTRDGRRFKSRVQAEGLFYGCLYKNFPELKEVKDAATNLSK